MVAGLIVDVSGLWSWFGNRNPPTLGLATYQLVNDRPVLTDGSVMVEVDPEDIFQDRMRLGVPIAVTNLEDDDLDVVRVELRYPANLAVESAGRGKIDPTGRTIVFDHDLGTLRATGDFSPIAPLDEIVIPFNFVVVPTVTVTKDGVPFYWVAVAGSGELPFEATNISMEATLYFANRPSIRASLHWSVEPGVELLSQGSDNMVQRPLTEADKAIFRPPREVPVQEWTQMIGDPVSQVRYRKFKLNDGADAQVITVNNLLRRVILDGDRDGKVDLDLIDTSGDGRPDIAGTYPEGRLFVDWWDGDK